MKIDKSLPVYTNNLFSKHYLVDILPKTEYWNINKGNLKEFIIFVNEIYLKEKDNLENYSESQLEEIWIKPILSKMGHIFQVQQTLDAILKEGIRKPDYIFYKSEEMRRKFGTLREIVDNSVIYAVGDAKKWNKNLNNKNSKGSSFDDQSPAFQICNYIQITNADWGILTNGRNWRLYNIDNGFKLNVYFDVDLEILINKDNIDDWKFFFLFFSPHSFIKDSNKKSVLSKILEESEQHSVEIGENLYKDAYLSLQKLCQGFLDFYNNNLTGENLNEIFQNSLIILYRLLFVLYAESRGILPIENEVYFEQYSLQKIRLEINKMDTEPVPMTEIYWLKLKTLFRIIEGYDYKLNDYLGVPKYDGGLFSKEKHSFLEKFTVGDKALIHAIKHLSETDEGKLIDYTNLDINHLGGIYERLLEYIPRYETEEYCLVKLKDQEYWLPLANFEELNEKTNIIHKIPSNHVFLATDKGERKLTGSYYTPTVIVNYINKLCSQKLLKKIKLEVTTNGIINYDDYVKRILNLKILDPAMGSGHFLVNISEHLASELLKISSKLSKEKYPFIEYQDEKVYFIWQKKVLENCIYGVDINPMAVELAKVTLWLSILTLKQPLSFLDHHLKEGNSLIGLKIDDIVKNYSSVINKSEILTNLKELIAANNKDFHFDTSKNSNELFRIEIDKTKNYTTKSNKLKKYKDIANIIIAERIGYEVNRTSFDLNDLVKQEKLVNEITKFLQSIKIRNPFHWEIEFPEVFFEENPGYDLIIGNPPYIKARDTDIPEVRNYLEQHYSALNGMWDMYIPFIERSLNLLKKNGLYSMIIPDTIGQAEYSYGIIDIIESKYNLYQIDFFPNIKIFKNIGIENKIIFVDNYISNEPSYRVLHSLNISSKTILKSIKGKEKYLLETPDVLISEEDTIPLSEICYVTYGLRLNSSKKDPAKFVKAELLSDAKTSIHKRKYTEGKYIEPYLVSKELYLEWETERCPERLVRPTFPELYKTEKLLLSRQKFIAAFSEAEKELICDNTIILCLLAKELKDIDNKSIQKYYKNIEKDRVEVESQSKNFSLKYILTLLNSKLIQYLIKYRTKGGSDFYPDDWKSIPIKTIPLKEQSIFIDISDKIIKTKNELISLRKSVFDYINIELNINNPNEKIANWFEQNWVSISKSLEDAYKNKFYLEKKIKVKGFNVIKKAEWKDYFDRMKERYHSIENRIDQLMNEVDELVYQLYGISESEIEIIESLLNKNE